MRSPRGSRAFRALGYLLRDFVGFSSPRQSHACDDLLMIFLDDSLGNWFVAGSRRELLGALLDRLPDQPDDQALALIAAGCLGRLEEDIVIRESPDV